MPELKAQPCFLLGKPRAVQVLWMLSQGGWSLRHCPLLDCTAAGRSGTDRAGVELGVLGEAACSASRQRGYVESPLCKPPSFPPCRSLENAARFPGTLPWLLGGPEMKQCDRVDLVPPSDRSGMGGPVEHWSVLGRCLRHRGVGE